MANQASETQIQKAIVNYLRLNGFFAFSIYNGSAPVARRDGRFSFKRNPTDRPRGLPDIIALKDGHTMYFEVKTATGRLSPFQKQIHKEMLEHGQIVHVVRSVDDVRQLVG